MIKVYSILLFLFIPLLCSAQEGKGECQVLGNSYSKSKELAIDAEVSKKLAFYCEGGVKYRIGVCGVNKHRNVALKIYDDRGIVVFDNKDYFDVNVWDFRVGEGKHLSFEVASRNGKELEGLTLLVGEKGHNWSDLH